VAANPSLADVSPPAFLQLAGNAVRWRLLAELSRSDLRVGELGARVGQPQNAVSYHLGRLRAGGLVSVRRSSADRRDSYYRLELTRCRELLAATGLALHPGLATTAAGVDRPRRAAKVRVLFLCTGNSARSQMAEALLAQAAGDWIEAFSAGSHPKALHSNAVRVMSEYGLDISGRRSKHFDEYAGRRFDYVVTLCDKVREVCPEFPGGPEPTHWSIPDPTADGGRADYAAFRRVAGDLETRIHYFISRIAAARTKG